MAVEFILRMCAVVIAVSRLAVCLRSAYFDMAEDVFFADRFAVTSCYIHSLGLASVIGNVQMLTVFIIAEFNFGSGKLFACKDDAITFCRIKVKNLVSMSVVTVKEESEGVCSFASFKQVRTVCCHKEVITITTMRDLLAIMARRFCKDFRTVLAQVVKDILAIHVDKLTVVSHVNFWAEM